MSGGDSKRSWLNMGDQVYFGWTNVGFESGRRVDKTLFRLDNHKVIISCQG
ncbi:hypothetical protein CEB3_c41670 [Peptococcaceae bacterium CEB3]|nr:hypothetical protein CEB3_c41670 [Peptococcaceae bacterium CEB3]